VAEGGTTRTAGVTNDDRRPEKKRKKRSFLQDLFEFE